MSRFPSCMSVDSRRFVFLFFLNRTYPSVSVRHSNSISHPGIHRCERIKCGLRISQQCDHRGVNGDDLNNPVAIPPASHRSNAPRLECNFPSFGNSCRIVCHILSTETVPGPTWLPQRTPEKAPTFRQFDTRDRDRISRDRPAGIDFLTPVTYSS